MAVSVSPAMAQGRKKLDRALQQAIENSHGAGKQKVIIRAKPGYASWLRQELGGQGEHINAEHPSIDGMALEMDGAALERLCAHHAVEGCSSDAEMSPTASVRALKTSPVAVNTLLANQGIAVDATGGAGITVALIDSGLFPSKAFAGRIKAFYDFTDGQTRRVRKAFDDYGHGTHVAGLIGGVQVSENKDLQGVAPAVQFVVIKVLNGNGKGKTSDVIRAVEFAVANRSEHHLGIDIINLSMGHPIFEPAASDPLVQAIEKASQAGVIVVASAGNYGTNRDTGEIGYAGTTSPGNAPSAITAGAYDHKGTAARDDDRVTGYSSRGPTWYDGRSKPDLVAPGHYLASEASPRSGLFTGYPTLQRRRRSGKAFLALSGTSMAAGVTSGVVALMQQAALEHGYPLTPNLVKAFLQYTAIPLRDDDGKPYDALTQGTGGLNAAGALHLARSVDVTVADREIAWTALTPCSVQRSACSTTIAGQPSLWSQNIIWGDTVVLGDLVYYNTPAWAQNIVWGEAADIVWGQDLNPGDMVVWGDNIIWGDNIVWGDSIVHGDNIVWGDNVIWGDNIVWGDNIIWGDSLENNIVWGDSQNIVWGEDDNIIWGNALAMSTRTGGGQQ